MICFKKKNEKKGQIGEVALVEIERSRNWGYVAFRGDGDAEAAKKNFDGGELNQQQIKITVV